MRCGRWWRPRRRGQRRGGRARPHLSGGARGARRAVARRPRTHRMHRAASGRRHPAPLLRGYASPAPVDAAGWAADGCICAGPALEAEGVAGVAAGGDRVVEAAFAASGMARLEDCAARVTVLPDPELWDETFASLAAAPPLVTLAGAAVGCAPARRSWAHLVHKPPVVGAGLPWHSDRSTWPFPRSCRRWRLGSRWTPWSPSAAASPASPPGPADPRALPFSRRSRGGTCRCATARRSTAVDRTPRAGGVGPGMAYSGWPARHRRSPLC